MRLSAITPFAHDAQTLDISIAFSRHGYIKHIVCNNSTNEPTHKLPKLRHWLHRKW